MKQVAIGCFDGVHLGHQAILHGVDLAITFRTHPLSLLAPDRAPRQIMNFDDRIAAIRACGVSEVVALDFTPELASMSPKDFLKRFLPRSEELTVRGGADWRFGKGGRGNAETLARMGIAFEVVPYAEYEGERVSSSRIRAALAAGEVKRANAMLGRQYSIKCCATSGKMLGSKMGFPTLNFVEACPMLPKGVYAVLADGAKAIANWGVAPTMGEAAWNQPVLEVHLIDSTPQPTTQPMQIEFLRYLREERHFESIEALKAQIQTDIRNSQHPQ